MALFENEPLIDVNVNGQTTKLPASVAASLGLAAEPTTGAGPGGGPRIAPAPVPVVAPTGEVPIAAPTAPMSVMPNGILMPGDQAAPPTPAPSMPNEYKAGTGDQATKEMKARAAERNKPAPTKPTPTDQLRAEGYGGAYADQMAANSAQQAATLNTAEAEARGLEQVAGLQAKRNIEIDKLLEQRNAQAQADLMALEKRNADYDAAIKKYADAKIDRSVDHPVMAAVSVLMSGLGMALMGRGAEKNPAIEALYTAIDRKVAGQMADLEKQGKTLGYQKDSIENMRRLASDRLAHKNLMIAGETERAARYIEELGSRTQSDVIRARAVEGAMALRARAADIKMAAVDKQTESDHKTYDRQQRDLESRRNAGVAYARIAEDKRQFDITDKRNQERLDIEAAKLLQAEQAAGNEARVKEIKEAEKENETRGIRNIATAEPLLNAKGNALFAEASKFDEEATKLENAAKDQANAGALSGKPDEATYQKQMAHVEALRTKAQQLRAEGRTFGQVRHRDPTQAGRISSMYASAQGATDLSNEIQELYDRSGKAWGKTDADRVAIRSKVTEMLMKYKNIWQLGVLSKQDTQLLREAGITDPTNVDADHIVNMLTEHFGKDPDAFKAGLDSLAKSAREDTVRELRTTTWDGKDPDKLFIIKKPEAVTDESNARKSIMSEKTIEEEVDSKSGRGVIRTIASAPIFPRGARPDTEDEAKSAVRAKDSAQYPGFNQKQAQHVDLLIRAWKSDDPKASERAANELLMLTKSDRGTLSAATMRALRDNAGRLYQQAYAQLPEKSPLRQQLDAEANATSSQVQQLERLAFPNGPNGNAVSGYISDLRKLAAKGNAEAVQVLAKYGWQ